MPILETFELDLARLAFLGLVDFSARFGDEFAAFDFVHNVELKCPDNVGGVLDVARLLETLEGDGSDVVVAVEAADDEKGGVGIALELFKLANGIVNAEFGGVF